MWLVRLHEKTGEFWKYISDEMVNSEKKYMLKIKLIEIFWKCEFSKISNLKKFRNKSNCVWKNYY